MSYTYAGRKKAPAASPADAHENISKSDMLRMSGAGAPQPMSPALREKFEPGFAADFSNIRISRGHIPEEMGVQAVAKGTDILIDSRAGMDVLGHELAHVVQQAQGRVAGGFPVVHDSALEHEADVMGARAASGENAMEGGISGFGGGMMSIAPMSGDSAPAQCKSIKEKVKKAPTEADKMNAGQAYMEKYRPLSQRTNHGKGMQKMFDENLSAEEQAGLAGRMDNMDLNFRALKDAAAGGGEEEQTALFDFMRKVSSMMWAPKMSYFGFDGGDQKDAATRKKAEAVTSYVTNNITNMASDETFRSPAYMDYLKNSIGSARESYGEEMDVLGRLKKSSPGLAKSRTDDLLMDEDFLRGVSAAKAIAGNDQAGYEYGAQQVDVGAENAAYLNKMTQDYTSGGDYYNQYFKRDFNEITANNGHRAPAAILNRQKSYETRGVPLGPAPAGPPRKKRSFGNWIRYKSGNLDSNNDNRPMNGGERFPFRMISKLFGRNKEPKGNIL